MAEKKRSPNFSLNDSLLLCELMGESSSEEGLSCHQYFRHKFTNNITSTSKRNQWAVLARRFNIKAESPRDVPSLQKKWDNLVQCHRSAFSDFLNSQRATGGGPCSKRLSTLTEAVMSVVGKSAATTIGVIGTEMDTSMIQVASLNASTSSNTTCTLSSEHVEVDNLSNNRFTATAAEDIDSDLVNTETSLSSKYSSVSVVCCQCQCHRRIEMLKEEKINLQIRLLKKQLGEE